MGKRHRTIWAVVGLLVAAGSLGAADWPQWRGPTRDGVATDVTLPDPWPEALKRVWQLEVGLGHSSPVVADGKVVQLARQGDDEVVQCIDAASGKVMWKASYAAGPFEPRPVARAHGKGPFATPAIADGKVYTLGVSGVLGCYDLASGKTLWQQVSPGDESKPYPMWGAAGSPLVDGQRLILAVGTDNGGALAALDKENGKTLWKLGDDGVAYASPLIATLADTRQIVTVTHSRVCGVDAEAGKLLWQAPLKVRYDMNIITPLVHDGVVVYSGYQEGTTAVRVAADNGALAATQLWHNEQESMFMSSPVSRGDCIYGVAMRGRGKGALVCLALADGATKWASPEIGEYASIVRVGDKLLVVTTDGDLLVVAADPAAYKELGRSHLTDSPVWAHLAIVGDRIYVKDKTLLACFALAGQ